MTLHGNIFFDVCPFRVNVQFNITKPYAIAISLFLSLSTSVSGPGCSRGRPPFLLQSGSYLCITVILPEYKIVGFEYQVTLGESSYISTTLKVFLCVNRVGVAK